MTHLTFEALGSLVAANLWALGIHLTHDRQQSIELVIPVERKKGSKFNQMNQVTKRVNSINSSLHVPLHHEHHEHGNRGGGTLFVDGDHHCNMSGPARRKPPEGVPCWMHLYSMRSLWHDLLANSRCTSWRGGLRDCCYLCFLLCKDRCIG